MMLRNPIIRAVAGVAVLFMLWPVGRVQSATDDTYAPQDMEMIIGDIQSVKVKNLSRISITDPSIADISDAKPDEVLLMAQRAGQTVLFLWDDSGKRSIVI